MEASLRNRTIALAGLFQSTYLVDRVARHGMADAELVETALGSLFHFDPPSIESVYGGVGALHTGLRTLRNQLGQDARQRNADLTRYAVALLHLERRLRKRTDLLQQLGERLQQADQQRRYFGGMHPNVIARLADLYQETISGLGPRIIVRGEQSHLSNPDNARRIRALLLAGIRATVLWRQAGGSRWRLLLTRRGYLQEADRLLREGWSNV